MNFNLSTKAVHNSWPGNSISNVMIDANVGLCTLGKGKELITVSNFEFST